MRKRIIWMFTCLLQLYYSHVYSQLTSSSKNVCMSDRGLECCFGHIISEDGSRCEDCPLGYYGYQCLFPCRRGKYGHKCRQTCRCSPDQECDNKLGCLSKLSKAERRFQEIKPTVVYTTMHLTNMRDVTTEGEPDTIRQNAGKSPFRIGNGKDQSTEVISTIYSFLGALVLACLVLMLVAIVTLYRRNKKESHSLSNPTDSVYHYIDDQALLFEQKDHLHSIPGTTSVACQHQEASNVKHLDETKYDYIGEKYDDCKVDLYRVAYSSSYGGHNYTDLGESLADQCPYADKLVYSDHQYTDIKSV